MFSHDLLSAMLPEETMLRFAVAFALIKARTRSCADTARGLTEDSATLWPTRWCGASRSMVIPGSCQRIYQRKPPQSRAPGCQRREKANGDANVPQTPRGAPENMGPSSRRNLGFLGATPLPKTE